MYESIQGKIAQQYFTSLLEKTL